MTRSRANLGAVAWLVTGCAGAEAPLPPDANTLAFDVPGLVTSGSEAATSPEREEAPASQGRRNYKQAQADVKAVSTGFREALYWPQRFLRALADEPAPQRAGDGWRWSRTLLDEGWQIRLTETPGTRAGTRQLELLVSGLRGEQLAVRDFVWMTGLEDWVDGQRRGAFSIFDPRAREAKDAVIAVTWSVAASGGRELIASNLSHGPRGGDQLRFIADGDIAWIAVRDARDERGKPLGAGKGKRVEVTWDRRNGAGRAKTDEGEEACWESQANREVDIPCPAGDWPPGSGQKNTPAGPDERGHDDDDESDDGPPRRD